MGLCEIQGYIYYYLSDILFIYVITCMDGFHVTFLGAKIIREDWLRNKTSVSFLTICFNLKNSQVSKQTDVT